MYEHRASHILSSLTAVVVYHVRFLGLLNFIGHHIRYIKNIAGKNEVCSRVVMCFRTLASDL